MCQTRDLHRIIRPDFHSGNILQDQHINETMQSYIADLGLSKKTYENASDGIYGVIPYVAPEVFLGEKFAPAANIYRLGIIMTEISPDRDLLMVMNLIPNLQTRFVKHYDQNLC
ncbi:hypothetical protein C2G38_2031852 [Gigaspora rosea]|uniref:Protein kinase domain-containing protein n=1 Tax=Gigaspora rosea TaxID=44941 RepID=A0A397VPP6_9GLOM|nr:hypothetical protein C2G38_2031852 [Gigaspora rosea]